MFKSIEKENLSHRIIDEIKDYIARKKLKPGDRLATERTMAEAFGVSRSSVREAVKVLEAIGVLESRPKHGISVRKFDPNTFFKYLNFAPYINKETILEMLEFRQTVELGMVDLVVERAGEEDLGKMAHHVEGMRNALQDPVSFYTHDWAFHLAIYAATRNPSIQAFERVLIEFFVTANRELWDKDRSVDPEHFKNHERIFLALKARDPDAMRQAIKDHYGTSLIQLKKRWPL